jgi:hypothetical protein
MSTRIYLLVATYEDEREPELLDVSRVKFANGAIRPTYEATAETQPARARILQLHIDYDLPALIEEVL